MANEPTIFSFFRVYPPMMFSIEKSFILSPDIEPEVKWLYVVLSCLYPTKEFSANDERILEISGLSQSQIRHALEVLSGIGNVIWEA